MKKHLEPYGEWAPLTGRTDQSASSILVVERDSPDVTARPVGGIDFRAVPIIEQAVSASGALSSADAP
jgi:hypothetical protein